MAAEELVQGIRIEFSLAVFWFLHISQETPAALAVTSQSCDLVAAIVHVSVVAGILSRSPERIAVVRTAGDLVMLVLEGIAFPPSDGADRRHPARQRGQIAAGVYDRGTHLGLTSPQD